jgi:hypothetical protein
MLQWLFGIAVGLALAAFGPSVFSLQRRRLRREQLLARYADLLAAASGELDRLRRLAAATDATRSEEASAETRSEPPAGGDPAQESDRHRLRQRAFAVRLLERDRELAERVRVLAAWEPSEGQAAGSQGGTAPEASSPPSAQALRERAAALERIIDDLCERVRHTHGEALWEGGWRAGWKGLMRLVRGEPGSAAEPSQAGPSSHPQESSRPPQEARL